MTSCGRYEITKPLGAGGMAEVFEGVAVSGGGITRKVAIKRLPAGRILSDNARTMFFDEARIASHLNHANIVGIIDYGEAEGAPFLVMEFVDGVDAKIAQDEIGNGKIPPGLALHICTEIAYALAHAHEVTGANGEPLGIVHRDVSPNNILLSWEGDVRLTDFGIATAYDRSSKTKTGFAKGKPAFMAPEQLLTGAVDGRTDCFSLGCTLHALLVGTSPLSLDDALPDFLNEQRLRLDPSIDVSIREIIDGATHYRKSARFESAEDMANALARARAQHLGSDSPRGRLKEWMAPHRTARLSSSGDENHPVSRKGDGSQPRDVAFVFDETAESVRRFSTVVVNKGAGTNDPAPQRKKWPIFMIATGAVGLLAYLLWPPPPDDSQQRPPPLTLESSPTTHETPRLRPPALIPDAATVEHAGEEPTVRRPTTQVPRETSRSPHSRPSVPPLPAPVRADIPPDAPPRMDPVPEPVTHQLRTLTIGGAGAHLSAVFVDRRRRGSAPTTLELPSGVHQVELRRRTESGGWETVERRSITLDERHTRRAPYRLIVR